ncbi:MAG TPA: UvrD-helicase domain-containing protein, partial [Arenibaculum sp.]|nr:UvrD-helicase domain-containing protein [Arenibaculum sp.]
MQRKYRWLFVDEFQDTDPIQAELLLLLASEPPHGDAGASRKDQGPLDWTTARLRPGALFVVGDPKQSIFRFRRADIDIYHRVRDRIVQNEGEVLELTTNFRSLPKVLAIANDVFPLLFPAAATAHSPRSAPLVPFRNEEEVSARYPRVFRLTTPAARTGVFEPAEARRIAAWIRAEVEAGRRQYGDFLVLTWHRPRLGFYASALEEHDIPVEVSGAGLADSREVRAAAQVLKVLADPLDGVALVGVLRGPLFGLSDPELFAYRRAGGRFQLNVPVPAGADKTAAGAVIQRLQELHHLTRTLALPSVFERVIADTGWLALAAASTPGGAAAGTLLQAVDRVRRVAELGGGAAEAAEVLLDKEAAAEEDLLPLEPGRRNVVRVMNLHKAKGLEADVVFLADPCHARRFDPVLRVIRDAAGTRGFLKVQRDGKQNHRKPAVVAMAPGWATHEAEEQVFMEAERLRLLYVAATRAAEMIVVGCSTNARHNEAWGLLDPALVSAPELPVPEAPVFPMARFPVAGSHVTRSVAGQSEVQSLAAQASRLCSAREARAERDACAKVPSYSVASVTSLAVTREPGSVSDAIAIATAVPGSSPVAGSGVGYSRLASGTAWGSLVHG